MTYGYSATVSTMIEQLEEQYRDNPDLRPPPNPDWEKLIREVKRRHAETKKRGEWETWKNLFKVSAEGVQGTRRGVPKKPDSGSRQPCIQRR
jgi:hypothetical protein